MTQAEQSPATDGDGLVRRLRSALAFAASRSCITSVDEQAILTEFSRITQLQADIARLQDPSEDVKRALVKAAIPLEAMILSGHDKTCSPDLRQGIHDGVQAARAALSPVVEGEVT